MKIAFLHRPLFVLLGLLFLSVVSVSSFSEPSSKVEETAVSSTQYEQIKTMITSRLGLNVSSVKASVVDNLLEVVTDQGLFYVTADGQHLIQGQLFSIGEQFANLTEQSLAQVRLAGIKKFENDMIVFPAEKEKYVVTVFTDITCGYCRKLHSQMAEYNKRGITIRYLAYPRQGIKDRAGNFTQNFKDMRSVWCADDPKAAMTAGKQGNNIPYRICDKPVAEEFEFGRQVGVNGTPAMILENGMMLPGYRQPDELLALLEQL
jgi:thiol:disulfide interchange protein DsbC